MKIVMRATLLMLCFSFLCSCSLYRGPSLFPAQPTDSQITAEVKKELQQHEALAPFHIQVQTQSGTVYLSGYVKAIRQSDTAGEIAGQVPGVEFVQNEIIVRK